ncbi:DegT/DnrJ/EryC1/StrS family aminotransferase [Flavobacterium sp. I-SCBP12n]|uniref:DegT/DnrJ/EryC1/StrS family aminotransferase n=1 Tax=Flavobacterium pygoscelis TaxID=2893176 RepID=A0A9X1XX80_9FLAO|nr:DegT/DnrJ/EryC1/StrS family aminotransferase [Flavobacterium pygoscelis]MCK8141432.1 DegT/DnrJ/EryC1/StrS family aminotransferase [Flavobacterium pygoscelis]
MEKDKIWLLKPNMGGGELKYIQEAFDSNWIAPAGSNLAFFENELEDYLGCKQVVALNSGTAAIHLGLILLDVQLGDLVLCQSMTFSASANPIVYLGAVPVFIDSELDTYNLCPIALEEAIINCITSGKKPKAIIAVALYGVPYKIEEIRYLADKYDIPILEDSAEALGSSHKGKMCGTFGDLGVLSFNGSKMITTSGGGALIASSKMLKNKAIFLATQARDDAPHYQHSEIGYNYRMSNICAGIGRGQMEILNEHLQLKKAIHNFYLNLFKHIDGVSVFEVPNSNFSANYWLNTILINPLRTKGINREMLRLAFIKENIESRPLWKPLHLQPIFSKYTYFGKKNAESIFENGLCLPSGPIITENEKERIQLVVNELFNCR